MNKPIALTNLLQSQIAQIKSRADAVSLISLDYKEDSNLTGLAAKFNEINHEQGLNELFGSSNLTEEVDRIAKVMNDYVELRKGETEVKSAVSNLVNSMVDMMTPGQVSDKTEQKSNALFMLVTLYNSLKSKKMTQRVHNKLDQTMLAIDKIFTVLFNENKRY